MTVRIGLTGPIGCGKSTVAAWLAELGAVVVDADRVARDVVASGEPALAEVLAAFGDRVRATDGSLDRAALGRIVFGDPVALTRLEGILHPAVRPRILAAMEAATEAGAAAVVVEAIKLVEGGLAAFCDEVWLVTCDAGAQRARLAARALPASEVEDRIDVQAGLIEQARPVATRVLDTSGSPAATRELVRAAYREATGSTDT